MEGAKRNKIAASSGLSVIQKRRIKYSTEEYIFERYLISLKFWRNGNSYADYVYPLLY